MKKITVVNKYKHTPTNFDFPIGRENPKFGNPFPKKTLANDRDVAVALFLRHFLERLPAFDKMLAPIRDSNNDSNLVCYCAPKKCHGDIYKSYIEFSRNLMPGLSPILEFRALHGYVSPVMNEGVDHINIYSGSRLPLGRMLSNFYRSPFELDGFGKFESMEGFWFYLATGCEHDKFKSLWGFEAKAEGKKIPRKFIDGFDDIIDKAVRAKLDQNPKIQEALKESNLPFEHYYWYGTPTNALITRSDHRFIETIHDYRSRLIGAKRTVIAGSRDIKDLDLVKKAIIDSGFKISTVISGLAQGVDIISYVWAKSHFIETEDYPVTKEDWEKSKAAGHIRNAEMNKVAEQGVILIKANSSGSEGMLNLMTKSNKPVHLVRIP